MLFDWTAAAQSVGVAPPPAPEAKPVSSEERTNQLRSAPQAAPLRILPDLTLPDPVDLLKREEEERRAALREAKRETRVPRRRRPKPETPRQEPVEPATGSLDIPDGIVSSPAAFVSEERPAAGHVTLSPVRSDAVMHQRKKAKRRAYQALCRKAKRQNLPLPPLRAGERWKRRLPLICR
jgi:hypothetical protein